MCFGIGEDSRSASALHNASLVLRGRVVDLSRMEGQRLFWLWSETLTASEGAKGSGAIWLSPA
jgi:hypothetical protein